MMWRYFYGREVAMGSDGAQVEKEVKKDHKKVKTDKSRRVGAGKMFAWQSRGIASGCNLMIVGYITLYCTDALGLDAAIVGILLLVSKIIDGFTDLIAGYLVDKTNTRLGKGRPYELSIIGLWLCTYLMYSCPASFAVTAKYIWVFSMYIMVNSIFYTFLNANVTAYTVRAFKYQEQYVAINTYGGIIPMVGVAAFNIALPTLLAKIATDAAGWSRLIGMMAVPLTALGLLRFFFIKETNDVIVKTEANEKVTFKDVKQCLTKDRFIFAIALVTLVMNFTTNMGVGAYYFKYIVKDLSKMSITTAAQVLTIPLMLLFPALIKKSSVSKLVMAGSLVAAVGGLINAFAGASIPLLAAASVCSGIGSVPASMLMGLLIIDCADFNEWQGISRMEGTLSAVNSFAGKIGAALASGLIGILLQASGYIGNAALIPQSAIRMIRTLYSWVPMALWTCVCISMLFYHLDTKMPQIRKELDERHAADGISASATEDTH